MNWLQYMKTSYFLVVYIYIKTITSEYCYTLVGVIRAVRGVKLYMAIAMPITHDSNPRRTTKPDVSSRIVEESDFGTRVGLLVGGGAT